MLFEWSQVNVEHTTSAPSLFTTFLAGILIYAIVVTCFRSILILFKSFDTNETDDVNYKAGHDLFTVAVLGSCAYVIMNVLSIYHFTITPDHLPLDIPARLHVSTLVACTVLVVGFFGYVAILLHGLWWLEKKTEKLQSRMRGIGRKIAEILFWMFVVIVVYLILNPLLRSSP